MGFSKWNIIRLALLLVPVLVSPAWGSEKFAAPEPEELKGIVEILEDPRKREEFLAHLKGLVAAWHDTDEQPEAVVEEPRTRAIGQVLARLEGFSAGALTAGDKAVGVIAGLPDATAHMWKFLRSPDNRSEIRGSALRAMLALAAALAAWVVARRYSRRLNVQTGALPARIFREAAAAALGVVPYVVLVSGHALASGSFVSIEVVDRIMQHVFVTAFLYKTAVEFLRLPFSPHHPESRILKIGEEYANYWWLWIVRLVNYSAFFYLSSGVVALLVADLHAVMFIRGALLVPFPLMLSVLLLQAGRELKLKFGREATVPGDRDGHAGRRFLPTALRYAPILAVVYVWLIAVFLITGHRDGFTYLRDATVGTLVLGGVLMLALRLVDRIFKHLFVIGGNVRNRFPDLEEKANRFITIARSCARGFLVVIAIGMTAQLWGVPVSGLITSKAGTGVILRGFTILLTLLAAGAVIQGSRFTSDYLLKGRGTPGQKLRTLVPMLKGAVKISACFVGGVIILQQLGVNTTPILAGAGILGLAVGFGAQTLVKDLINGIFILFEESIRVGDWVDLGGNGGIVESVGLRTVTLRDASGNVHVIPNSAIDRMVNFTKEFSRVIVDVGVAYRENVEDVIEILKEIGLEMEADEQFGTYMLEPLEILGLDRFEDSAVVIRVRFTTKPMLQWMVRREFNKRVKRAFDARGIEIPFPHRTIYIGESKDGTSPPLRVDVRKAALEVPPEGPVS